MNNFVRFTIILAIFATAGAGISFTIEPRRLINGLLLNLALACDVLAAGGLIIASNNQVIVNIALAIFLTLVVLIGFFVLLHVVWLIWNAVIVWRRESHSLANMLTLLLAIVLIAIDLFSLFGEKFLPGFIYQTITSILGVLTGYLLLTLWNFLTVLFAYNLRRPLHNQDYLIVLGAGLIDGHKVSRLLGARIDRAITYYRKQEVKGQPLPKIIFSGGQGSDEQTSEAAAMRQYALEKGIPAADTILEDKSRTTLQNMQFSAKIINCQTQGAPYRAQFCTNNYHLFRAGLFAKQAGLNANGLGAHTAPYFLPNATIREYAAIFIMNKKRHAITLGILLIPSLYLFIDGLIKLI